MVTCVHSPSGPRDLGPVPDGSLMTDATGYVAEPVAGSAGPVRYRFRIITRFQNRSTAPVYLARCDLASPQPIYFLFPADSSASESDYNPFWACVGHDKQFEVLPGAVRVDTFRIVGPNAFDGTHPQGVGATDGAFRLSLDVRSTSGDGAPRVPGSLGRSNAFVVRTSK